MTPTEHDKVDSREPEDRATPVQAVRANPAGRGADPAVPDPAVPDTVSGANEPPRMAGPTGSQPLSTELVGDPEAADAGSAATRGAAGGATVGLLAGGVVGAIPGAIAGAVLGAAAEGAEPDDATDLAPGSTAADPAGHPDAPPPAVDREIRTPHGVTTRVDRHPNPTDR